MRIQRPTISQPTITEPTITELTSLTGDGANITGSFSGSFVGELTGPTSASFAGSIASNTAATTAASSSLASDLTTTNSNVTSLGVFTASLDTNIPSLVLPASTTISTFGKTLVGDADAEAVKTTISLENVTNESKATMFTSPTFTGTVSGVTATHVGLENVDNTSDADKPVSTATQTALDLKANLASPTFTGTVTIPTQATSDDSTKAASTAYVTDKIQEVVAAAPAALDTLNELAAAIGDDADFAGTVTTSLGEKLVKASNLSDLTNAATALTNLGLTATAAEINKLDGVTATTAELNFVDGVTSNIQTQLDAKAASSALTSHTGDTTNPHSVTATQVGLGTTADVQFDSLGIGTAAPGTSGVIRATNDIIAYYSSDERLKDNFKPLTGALDKVKLMGGYEFDWNSNQDVHEGHDIGVKAQEVQAQYPELVHERDNGYLAVDYVKLTAVLVEAVKELSAKVDELSK